MLAGVVAAPAFAGLILIALDWSSGQPPVARDFALFCAALLYGAPYSALAMAAAYPLIRILHRRGSGVTAFSAAGGLTGLLATLLVEGWAIVAAYPETGPILTLAVGTAAGAITGALMWLIAFGRSRRGLQP